MSEQELHIDTDPEPPSPERSWLDPDFENKDPGYEYLVGLYRLQQTDEDRMYDESVRLTQLQSKPVFIGIEAVQSLPDKKKRSRPGRLLGTKVAAILFPKTDAQAV